MLSVRSSSAGRVSSSSTSSESDLAKKRVGGGKPRVAAGARVEQRATPLVGEQAAQPAARQHEVVHIQRAEARNGLLVRRAAKRRQRRYLAHGGIQPRLIQPLLEDRHEIGRERALAQRRLDEAAEAKVYAALKLTLAVQPALQAGQVLQEKRYPLAHGRALGLRPRRAAGTERRHRQPRRR